MNRALIFILIGVAVVMSITTASFIVLTKFTPERETRLMLKSMSQLTSLSHQTGINWTQTNSSEKTATTIFLSGELDLSDPSAIDHRTNFRLVRVNPAQTYNDLSGEIRSKHGRIFLTYSTPGPIVPGVDFSTENSWVSFAPGEFTSWGSIFPGVASPLLPSPSQSSWKPETVHQMRELLSLADVFLLKFDGVTEKIRHGQTRLINEQFDEDALFSFFLAWFRLKEGRDAIAEERFALQNQAKQLEGLQMQFWIGKKDHLLYRLRAFGSIKNDELGQPMSLDVRIELSDMNKPVEIDTPSTWLPFADVLQRSFLLSEKRVVDMTRDQNMTFTETQQVALPVQEIFHANDFDQDGLDSLLETFYLTDPHRADTDGDGMNDGDEVSSNRNPRGKGTLFGFGL